MRRSSAARCRPCGQRAGSLVRTRRWWSPCRLIARRTCQSPDMHGSLRLWAPRSVQVVHRRLLDRHLGQPHHLRSIRLISHMDIRHRSITDRRRSGDRLRWMATIHLVRASTHTDRTLTGHHSTGILVDLRHRISRAIGLPSMRRQELCHHLPMAEKVVRRVFLRRARVGHPSMRRQGSSLHHRASGIRVAHPQASREQGLHLKLDLRQAPIPAHGRLAVGWRPT